MAAANANGTTAVEKNLKKLSINSSSPSSDQQQKETWVFPFKDAVNYLNKSEQWYKFLNSLYSKFSEYEILKDRRKYNVASLEDWGKGERPQGIKINRNNFEAFLNKISEYNIAEYDNIKNILVTGLQLEELNHVLNLTLKHKVHISCIESCMFIKGNYIIFVEVALKMLSKMNQPLWRDIKAGISKYLTINIIIDDSCDLTALKSGLFTNVFALNTVFIDVDVSMGYINSKQLAIIAPKWEIIGTRDISVDGTEGTSHYNSTVDRSKAQNGAKPGAPGTNGKPGGEGGPGGTFIGIGKQFIGGENLTITANGGMGGSGEDGGDGGNGGSGGKGGIAGNIILFELNNYSGILKYKFTGRDGVNGKGGIGGRVVSNGDDIVVSSNSFLQTDGAIAPTEHPKSKDIVIEPAKIINKYKSYLRENLNDRFKKNFLTEFENTLESNPNVKNVYNTLGLVDELQALEEQFQQLNKDIDVLPFYHSLLDRINEYAKNPKEVQNQYQYKKVLSYLYTATLGKIYNLQDNLELNLIINIAAYLDSVEEDINRLKILQNAQNKKDIINKYKQDYKKAIDKKIAEAKNLISKEITPEIDNIGTEIDNKIELLTDEVIALQEQNDKESQKLIEKQQQLKYALELQCFFAPFKILGQVVSFLGPAGAVAGSAIGIGMQIAESFVLDDQNSQHNILQLPQSVSDLESIIDQIKTTRNQKITRFKKTLEDISQGINEHPEKLGNISVKIADIKSRLNKIDGKRVNFKEIQFLENELKEALQTQEGELIKTQEVIYDQKTKKALVTINNFKKAVKLSSEIFDIYSKYKNSQARLDIINDAIEQKKNEFQKLKQYEEKIYDVITPTLQNMQDDLKDVANKLGKNSSVALEVTKWQVQSTVRNMKLQMKQITQGLKVQDNIARCIEKLEEAMTVLINVYDHIQHYQEDQNLANFIADISSAGVSNINITDSELSNAKDSLEIVIRSNLVLKQYQTAIDGFKQFVFPFAHIYFKTLVLPSHLELGGTNKNNTTLENLVYKATTQIEQIRSKLKEYKNLLKTPDSSIGIGEFNSYYKTTQPFFVWKNEQNKNAISKLLSGQEVIVKADIMNSSTDKDAIKFNTIELKFKSKNGTAQFEVNNILDGFKISMTHLGNSYYRYNDKIYSIITNSEVFWYGLEKNNNSEPIHRSISYEKLKNGDFMLSPYAFWKIKLINIENRYNFSFKDLEIYKDKIDLELEGNGYYVMKEGVNEDLFLEQYYKVIDIHDRLDLNVDNNELTTMPLLQDSNSTRNKREANQELKNEILQSQSSRGNTEHENSNIESSSWFSWIRLPSFNILPGAEANVIQSRNLINQKDYVTLGLYKIIKPFTNTMQSLKNVVLSKISKPTDNIINSNSLEKTSNNYTDYIIREDTSNSLNNLTISFDGSDNNIQPKIMVDINGNFILGQLIVHKVCGSNKSFSSTHYVSSEQEQNIKINKLASEILPMINNNLFSNYKVDNFITNYESESQWYKDVMKDRYEKILSKRCQRIEKHYIMCTNSSEEVFADSVWMFGEVMNYGNNDINNSNRELNVNYYK